MMRKQFVALLTLASALAPGLLFAKNIRQRQPQPAAFRSILVEYIISPSELHQRRLPVVLPTLRVPAGQELRVRLCTASEPDHRARPRRWLRFQPGLQL